MRKRHRSTIGSFKKEKGHISLTFDDGPDKKNTPKILNTLKKFGVKATFFIVGKKAKENPDIVLRIFKEGHDIGNHTYSHPVSPIINYNIIEKEISLTGAAVKRITGQRPLLFRPTWASWDICSKKMLSVTSKLGYFPVRWSISSMDWLGLKKVIKYNILDKGLKHGDIILLHDGAEKSLFSKRKATIDLLPEILHSVKSKNFIPLKLTELLQV